MSSRNRALGRVQGVWTPTTLYLRGDVVTYLGGLYAAIDTFTSGATFTATNWDLVLTAPYIAGVVVTTKTTSYPLTDADSLVLMNGTTLTATLPTPVGRTGRQFTVKNINTSPLVLATAAGTIDGAATVTLAQYDTYTVTSDGTSYFVV